MEIVEIEVGGKKRLGESYQVIVERRMLELENTKKTNESWKCYMSLLTFCMSGRWKGMIARSFFFKLIEER